jgi:tripartite-type tricarboxylate transporter receptor subunit TctC
MPRPIVQRLHKEITAIFDMPEVRERILKTGFVPVKNPSVDELEAFMKTEIVRWGKVVKQAGLAGSH